MLARSATAKRPGIDRMTALRFHIRKRDEAAPPLLPARRKCPVRFSPTTNLAVDEIDDEAIGETHAEITSSNR
jgi:hypothetical protein